MKDATMTKGVSMREPKAVFTSTTSLCWLTTSKDISTCQGSTVVDVNPNLFGAAWSNGTGDGRSNAEEGSSRYAPPLFLLALLRVNHAVLFLLALLVALLL